MAAGMRTAGVGTGVALLQACGKRARQALAGRLPAEQGDR